jgi:hypothetical protein
MLFLFAGFELLESLVSLSWVLAFGNFPSIFGCRILYHCGIMAEAMRRSAQYSFLYMVVSDEL